MFQIIQKKVCLLCSFDDHLFVYESAGIYRSVKTFMSAGFECLYDESGLHEGFSSRESYPAAVPEKDLVFPEMFHKLLNRVFSAAKLPRTGRAYIFAYSASVTES